VILTNLASHCPAKFFPLLGQTQGRDVLWLDQYLKEFLDTAHQLGTVKTCQEFDNYYGCLGRMTERAKKECSGDMGMDYVNNMNMMYWFINPALETGVILCRTRFNALRDHFKCVTNSDLIVNVRNCSRVEKDGEAIQKCAQDEIAKDENCKEGVYDIFRAFSEILFYVQNGYAKQMEAMKK